MKAILLRNADTVFGVFGYLTLYTDDGRAVAEYCTGEDDWLNNRPRESCIPAGEYMCKRTIYQKHNIPTFEITRVPDRSRILFHPGNTEEDTEGCVLLGHDFGALTVRDEDAPGVTRVKWAITRSGAAFADFMAHLEQVSVFPLSVEWSAPGAWRTV